MKKNKLSKYLLFVAMLTLITTIVVVIQNSYSRLIVAQKLIDRQVVAPFNPAIDVDVLDKIDSMLEAPPDFIPPAQSPVFDVAPSPVP